jgi:YjbE family integral membrane protein
VIDLSLDPAALLAGLLIPAQILFVNLLLSADNALVIAMACRGLRAEDVQRATMLGIVGAIVLRLAMGSAAIVLLRAPLLQLAAGVVLLFIAVRLTLIDGSRLDEEAGEAAPSSSRALMGAVWTIVVADVTMSLDNVVAIAAIAQGSLLYIAIGLALSVPMLIWGSNLIRELLDGAGWLVLVSGAFLGWVAGGVAVADSVVAPAIAAYAPALPYAVPAAFAVFVVWQNFILDPRRARLRGRHAS